MGRFWREPDRPEREAKSGQAASGARRSSYAGGNFSFAENRRAKAFLIHNVKAPLDRAGNRVGSARAADREGSYEPGREEGPHVQALRRETARHRPQARTQSKACGHASPPGGGVLGVPAGGDGGVIQRAGTEASSSIRRRRTGSLLTSDPAAPNATTGPRFRTDRQITRERGATREPAGRQPSSWSRLGGPQARISSRGSVHSARVFNNGLERGGHPREPVGNLNGRTVSKRGRYDDSSTRRSSLIV